jgi:hypothetical protein
MEIDEIANLLEEIALTASSWHEIGTTLRKQGLRSPENILWKYVFAFEYMYVEEENADYIERYGPFAPWIEMQARVFPPPLNTISDEFLEEWASVLEKIRHPVLCSRLADLLWVRRWGESPYLYARQAIDSYSEVSKDNWVELDRANCLIRALDLSKEIKDEERKASIISLMIDACNQELKSESPKPGVSLRLIKALMKLHKSEIPSEVDMLLDMAIQIHQKDAWIVEDVLALMMRRADTKRLKELQHYQINRWVEEAEKCEKGLIRLYHLEHALELSRNYGFQDVADKMRRKIQLTPEEDFELKTISAKVEVPNEKVEAYLNWFIDEKGWRESLTRFGHHGPPSGDYKKNIEEVKKQSQEFPLQFLVTRAVYDEFNAPIRFGRSMDENMDIVLASNETIGIRVFGTFAPEILKRVKQKHCIPSIDELTEFFLTPIITSDISENIAEAIDWYYKDEYDASAHLLVPRIEAIIRTLARDLGLPIIREPVGTTPGGVIQLGNLLSSLNSRMDESWRRYLYNVLANPIGINLRNRICHGLIPKVGKEDAALLIHVVCYLRLIRFSKPDESKKSE